MIINKTPALAFTLFMVINLFNMGLVQAQTSSSDCPEYKKLCLSAAINEQVFNTFKSNPEYMVVLEHVNPNQGREYLNYIITNYPHLIRAFKKFHENDALGSPIVYDYPEIGATGPTTLRYVKVLGDLEFHFGNLERMKMIEIGAGYGGQCLIISKAHHFDEYQLVDLPETLMLINRYLSAHKITNFKCVQPDAIPSDEKYDLVISNYAFSECVRSVQEVYFEKIIKNSKHGYMTLNLSRDGRYTSEELVETLRTCGFNPRILDEVPQTGYVNCILIW